MSFVCAECRTPIKNPRDMFTERMEYRRLDSMERPLSIALRDVCRECVRTFAGRHRNPSGAVQEAMEF